MTHLATFKQSSSYPNQRLLFDNETFTIEGSGAVDPRHIPGFDSRGELDWASTEMRDWAYARLNAARVSTAPNQAISASSPAKPVYKQTWFIVLVIVAVLLIPLLCLCSSLGLLSDKGSTSRSTGESALVEPSQPPTEPAGEAPAALSVSLVAPTGSSVDTTDIQLRCRVTHDDAVVSYSLDGESWTVMERSSAGIWTAEVSLAVGENTVMLRAVTDSEEASATVSILCEPSVALDLDDIPDTVQGATVKITGTTDPRAVLLVNGTEIPVGDDGSFSYDCPLDLVGSNSIEIEVSREHYKSVSMTCEVARQLTMGQRQAVAKAEGYLDMMPFSRSGLIGQLEFEGFSTADATFAVDHIDPDWNEQAALKAQAYLDMMSFSRSGLISQLRFEGFTQAQAEYGVAAVGY